MLQLHLATFFPGRNSYHGFFTANIRHKKCLAHFWGFENPMNCDREGNTIRGTVTCKLMSSDLYTSHLDISPFKTFTYNCISLTALVPAHKGGLCALSRSAWTLP